MQGGKAKEAKVVSGIGMWRELKNGDNVKNHGESAVNSSRLGNLPPLSPR